MEQRFIRNFSIIAHIDHGKSTIADRFLQLTGALSDRELSEQFLDSMDLEKERGITIKAQAVRLEYKAKDGQLYYLNFIDTPGHVDFSYEVSRSLASCDGALLIVDASQGVEAQTLANVYLAIENDLEIIPVFNKIDLPHADVDKSARMVEEVIGIETDGASLVSAKTGEGIPDLLESIVQRIPAPTGNPESPLQALIFDSWFDPYRGVMVLVRVFEGTIKVKDRIYFKHTDEDYEVLKLAVQTPHFQEVNELSAGEVGLLICGIKTVRDIKVGDTVVHKKVMDTPVLEGFQEVKPMVFSGMFPIDTSEYDNFKEALEKLALNDSSFTYDPETSAAIGLGFRCGFLGMLHMNIVQERLEREFNLSLISTAPSVNYQVRTKDGGELYIDNPSELPEAGEIEEIKEPIVGVYIHTPGEYVGKLIKLCEDKRGVQTDLSYISEDRVQLSYDLPLSEIVYDFYDRLKSFSRGYASMDYDLKDYRTSKLVKLDIALNGEPVDALSIICHGDDAYRKGRNLVQKLRSLIPRQQFDVAVQATIGKKVIARETRKAFRKNVLAKCYGGDISRKRKLLEKQKAGKRRMKMVGNVEVPQEAFYAVLKVDD